MSTRRPPWRAKDYADAVRDSYRKPPPIAIAIALRDQFWSSGRGKVSHSRLAAMTGYGTTTVNEWLRVLEKDGFISRKAPSKAGALRHGAMTHYTLHVPSSKVTASRGHDTQTVQPASVTASRGSGVTASRGTSHHLAGTPSIKKVGGAPERPARSAGATHADARTPRPRVQLPEHRTIDKPTPWDVELTWGACDEADHFELTAIPLLDIDERRQWKASDFDAGYESFRQLARWLAPTFAETAEAVLKDHHCSGVDTCRATVGLIDDEEPLVSVILPSSDGLVVAHFGFVVRQWVDEYYPEASHTTATTAAAPTREEIR